MVKKGYIYTVSAVLMGGVVLMLAFYTYSTYTRSLQNERFESALPPAQQHFDSVAMQVLDLAGGSVRLSASPGGYNVTFFDNFPHRGDNMDFFDWNAYNNYLSGPYYNMTHANLTAWRFFSAEEANVTFRISVLPPGGSDQTGWRSVAAWGRMNRTGSNFSFLKSYSPNALGVQRLSVAASCQNKSSRPPYTHNGTDSLYLLSFSYEDGNRSIENHSLNEWIQVGPDVFGAPALLFAAEFNDTPAYGENFSIWAVDDDTIAMHTEGNAKCSVNVTMHIGGITENHTSRYDFNTMLNYSAQVGTLLNASRSAVVGRQFYDASIYESGN